MISSAVLIYSFFPLSSEHSAALSMALSSQWAAADAMPPATADAMPPSGGRAPC